MKYNSIDLYIYAVQNKNDLHANALIKIAMNELNNKFK